MASIEVTISGVLYDKLSRTSRPCVLIGEASLTGLGVGGGPMPPGEGGGEHPEHPDSGPGRPGWEGGPKPSHPIALPGDPWWPKPPTEPPENPEQPKPPPEDGGWGWHPEYGWGYFPMAGGPAPHTK